MWAVKHPNVEVSRSHAFPSCWQITKNIRILSNWATLGPFFAAPLGTCMLMKASFSAKLSQHPLVEKWMNSFYLYTPLSPAPDGRCVFLRKCRRVKAAHTILDTHRFIAGPHSKTNKDKQPFSLPPSLFHTCVRKPECRVSRELSATTVS